jgi:FKBP-type peptidyl-prolyl cis-trans isomerase
MLLPVVLSTTHLRCVVVSLFWIVVVISIDVTILEPHHTCTAFVIVTHNNHHHYPHHQSRPATTTQSLQSNALLLSLLRDNRNDGFLKDTTAENLQRPNDHSLTRRSVVTNGFVQLVPFVCLTSKTSTADAAVTTSSSSTLPPKKDLKEDYRQGTAALNSAMEEDMAPVPREAYIKLPSGVIYADVVQPPKSSSSSNVVVQPGSKVNLQWVLRRSNGYFVDASQLHDSVPFVFTVGDTTASTTAIAGLDEGIRGMQVGGVRRLLIPPALAYVRGVEDGLPGPIPVGFGPRQQIRRIQTIRKDVPGEYIYLEIQLTRLR